MSLLPIKTPEKAKPGEWDRQAACCPALNPNALFHESGTFSVGIFQWESAENGRCKKGAAQRRVSGLKREAPNVVAKADQIVSDLNAPRLV